MARHGGRDYALIRLASSEVTQYPCDQLERVPEVETRADAFTSFRFAGPDALERALLTEKIRGQLTEVVYSMESGRADFYAHQFRPVLKLVSSVGGRILIADEVGLGKTIEAIYIWKELQARAGARRLLVVCPSMLQEKWRNELQDRFSIDATAVNAEQLHDSLIKASRDPNTSFNLIGSLESLRTKRPTSEDDTPKGAKQELAEYLANYEIAANSDLLDLVVIDEAHYLRNPATASHYLASLLAGVASHLVLLTATPIQIASENLFYLLSLLDAERYANLNVFNLIREANRPIIQALSAVLRIPPDIAAFRSAMAEVQQNQFFRGDAVLSELTNSDLTSPDARIEVARLLESRSLLSDVLTRTRKRDVIKNRVERNAIAKKVELAPVEIKLYEQIKEKLRERALRSGSVQTLAMVGRLRQLGSCIPAAIKGWRDNSSLSELLWEDLGLEYEDDETEASTTIANVDLSMLEEKDTKYRALVDFIRSRLSLTPSEKIILFSFYRGTIAYLERRLRADGITCSVILGGMGDEKHRELARFADPKGPSVLISSEVGSEGIDLQFAKVLINYDLPWNPMKLEQRIGRIDRLGQKSDKIHIINFVATGTIEEIVFDRLYNRLRIFEESIGDLEEVLGQSSDELLIEYFRDGLTDAELARRLEQNVLTAERHRVDAEELEKDAPELVGHTDFILSHIQKDRELGRWIRPQDLLRFVTDVLADLYPGSRIERHKSRNGVFEVNLSTDARASLQIHIETFRPARFTRCHVPGEIATVAFSIAEQMGSPRPEIIDLSHPLVLWLRAELDRRGEQAPAVAIELSAGRSSIPVGIYTFAVDLWRMDGLQKQIVMRSKIVGTDDSSYDGEGAEQVIDEAARFGRKLDVYQLSKESDPFINAFAKCEASLEDLYAKEAHLFQLDNEQRVRQATIIAEERAAKKLAMLRERLAGQRASDDERRRRAIPLTEGQIKRLEADRDQRVSRIKSMEYANTATRSVSGGIIVVR